MSSPDKCKRTRPKPPPKPKILLAPKQATKPNEKQFEGGNIPINKTNANGKPPRPKLPVRPPSIKKKTEKENANSNENMDNKSDDLKSSSNESRKNDEVGQVSFENPPPLHRSMSGPAPFHDKVNLEKKRSISMRTEENSGQNSTLQNRPIPKPRKFTSKNIAVGLAKPVPIPRAKKKDLPEILKGENIITIKENLVETDNKEDVTEDSTKIEDAPIIAELSQHMEEENNNTIQKSDKNLEFVASSEQIATVSTEECTDEISQHKEDKECEHIVAQIDSAILTSSMNETSASSVVKQENSHPYENIVVSLETSKGNKSPAKHAGNPYENVPNPLINQTVNKTEMESLPVEQDLENQELSASTKVNSNDLQLLPTSTVTEGSPQPSILPKDIIDFKHLRIDRDEGEDNESLYSTTRKESLMDDNVSSLWSTFTSNEGSPIDSYYQSPQALKKFSPSHFADSESKAEIDSPEAGSKRIRRRAPHPPTLELNVLRSKAKTPYTEQCQAVKSARKQLDYEEISFNDQNSIYVTPKIGNRMETARNTELTSEDSVKQSQSHSTDSEDDHIYKEPILNAEDLSVQDGVPGASSGPSAMQNNLYSSCLRDGVDSDNEYVEPTGLTKLEGSELIGSSVVTRNSYTDTCSSGSTRSSIAFNTNEDTEYVTMNDPADIGHRQTEQPENDSSDDQTFEYIDMKDHTPSSTPTKDNRPISNVYLQPLSVPVPSSSQKLLPTRPAPPPPNRPVRRPENLPLPKVPTPPTSRNEQRGHTMETDSLDGHYERIRSLQRDMGLNLTHPDVSDTDTESEDEERSQQSSPSTDDGKERGKLYHIANEILSTEKTFVDALKLVCQDFGGALKDLIHKDPTALPKHAYGQMFSDIELIYELDKKFLQELGERMKAWEEHQRIGDLIREFGHFLKMYTNYIKGYDKTMAVFQDNFQRMPKFAALVKEYESNPAFKNLKITMFMLKPIQRIPSYRLLLIDYLKHLPKDSVDYEDISNGLTIVSKVADHINESMKEGDKFRDMLKLQAMIINNKEIVKPGRYLLKEGNLYKLSRREAQERMFFLLTDCLFYCEHAAGHNQYKLRQELPLAGMSLLVPDSIDFIKEFTIISTKRSFTLVASTEEERDEWATAIQNAIDDVSRKMDTFAVKREHSDRSSGGLSPVKELGKTAPRWVPDDRATMCSICCKRFTTYNRRHHCRACGEIVCKDCSSYEAPLHYMDLEQARVCEKCYKCLYETMFGETLDNEEEETAEKETGTKLKRSKSAMNAKFRVIKKKKRERKDRKTLPSKLTEVSAHEQENQTSGYLWITKKKKLKKRWFVLKDHVLYAYKAPSDPAANFTIPVLGYEVNITGQFEAEDFTFQLTHKGLKEPLMFKADNKISAEKWTSSLADAAQLNPT